VAAEAQKPHTGRDVNTIRDALLDLWATTPTLDPQPEAQDIHREALDALARLEEQLQTAQELQQLDAQAHKEWCERALRAEEQFEVARDALERIAQDYSPAKRAGAEAALALTRIDRISNPAKCPNCGGYGEVMQWMYGDMEKCSKCDGSGEAPDPAISPEASVSTKSGRSSDATADPPSWASAGDGEGKSTEDSRGSRSGTPPSASSPAISPLVAATKDDSQNEPPDIVTDDDFEV